MNKHIVEIGMPVYNAESTVSKALTSIVNQDFKFWRLIISNNASTDSTLEICKKFARTEKRIEIIEQSSNNGGWNNFNYVLNHSRGKFFKWQAADDIMSPNFLSINLGVLLKNPDLIGVSSPDYWDWEFAINQNPIEFNLTGDLYNRLINLSKNCRRANGLFYGLFRAEYLKQAVTQDLFTSSIQEKDWVILARLARFGNIGRSSGSYMILGSNGASNSKDLTWYEQLTTLRMKIFPYYKFHNLVFASTGNESLSAHFAVILWIIKLQLLHIKGLIRLFLIR